LISSASIPPVLGLQCHLAILMSQSCLWIGFVLGFGAICSSGQAVPGYEMHEMLDCWFGKGGFCEPDERTSGSGACDDGHGIDIGYKPDMTSAEACGEACDGDSYCSCFVFMRVQNKCFLRQHCTLEQCERRNPGDKDQFDTFTKVQTPAPAPAPPPPPPNVVPYHSELGKLCGQEIATFFVTEEYAKAYCSQSDNCKGFYYNRAGSKGLEATAEGGCPCYYDGTMHDCNKSPFQGDNRCVCGTSGSDWRSPDQCKGPAPSPTPEGCPCIADGQWHSCYGTLVKHNQGTCANPLPPGQKVEVHFFSSWNPCDRSVSISGNSAPLVDSQYMRYRPQFALVRGYYTGSDLAPGPPSVSVGDAMKACVEMHGGCDSMSFNLGRTVTPADLSSSSNQDVTYFKNTGNFISDTEQFSYQSVEPIFEESASASVSTLVV